MDNFERWKYYVGCAENQRGEKLTEEQLRKWSDDLNHLLECLFCQIAGLPSYFQLKLEVLRKGYTGPTRYTDVIACPRCKEYKGIQPHIPGWSDFE